MKIIGITKGNKKSDNTPYMWIYYTEENKNVEGLSCDKAFFRKHFDCQVGQEFEFEFTKKDGKFYPNGIKITK